MWGGVYLYSYANLSCRNEDFPLESRDFFNSIPSHVCFIQYWVFSFGMVSVFLIFIQTLPIWCIFKKDNISTRLIIEGSSCINLWMEWVVKSHSPKHAFYWPANIVIDKLYLLYKFNITLLCMLLHPKMFNIGK